MYKNIKKIWEVGHTSQIFQYSLVVTVGKLEGKKSLLRDISHDQLSGLLKDSQFDGQVK